MKDILIVILEMNYGGAEKSLINLLNEMDTKKYKINLLLFKKNGTLLSQIPKFVNIIETPNDICDIYNNSFRFNRYTFLKLIGTLISLINSKWHHYQRGFRWVNFYKSHIQVLKKHYDVALAYTAGEIMYYTMDKVNADKKVVIVHGDYRSSHYPKKYDYKYFSNVNRICSVSDKCVDILKEEFPEFAEKIKLLPNISSSQLIRKRAMDFYPIEYDRDYIRILSVGRLSKEKGFDLAVETARILKEKGFIFKWFIIGSGKLEEELKQKVLKYNINDYIEFLGEKENPYPYILNCDIFVQPSRYEGKSVVLDEAKILCKPIVATNYPTVIDQINENEGLVTEISADGIASGIEKMFDKNVRKKYSDYLNSREYGNQKDIELYYDVIDN